MTVDTQIKTSDTLHEPHDERVWSRDEKIGDEWLHDALTELQGDGVDVHSHQLLDELLPT